MYVSVFFLRLVSTNGTDAFGKTCDICCAIYGEMIEKSCKERSALLMQWKSIGFMKTWMIIFIYTQIFSLKSATVDICKT